MFAARYYTGRHFARRYFPSGTAAVLRTPGARRIIFGSRTSAVLLGADTRTHTITGNAARSTIYGR